MEQYFEIDRDGKTLRGRIHIPEPATKRYPCIIYCHGFTGAMTGSHRMFVKTARAIEKLGCVSVRFDCLGSGESDGEFADMTLSGEADDCVAVYDYIKSKEFVDPNHIGLLGHSMGGPVVISANCKLGGKIDKTILLSTAATLFHELIMPMTGDKLKKFMKEGTLDFGGNTIGKKLLDNIYNMDIFGMAEKMSGRVLLVHGSEDGESPVYNSVKLKELLGSRAQLKLIEGADHCYSSPTFERQVIEEICRFVS